MTPVPETDDDCLAYVAELFTLDDGDVPTDAIVILGFMGKARPGESGSYWRYRIGGDAVTSTCLGLVDLFKHELAMVAYESEERE